MSTAVRHRTRLHHDQRAVLRRRRSHVSLQPVKEFFISVIERVIGRYECVAGYFMVGFPSRICNETGQWLGYPPVCVQLPETEHRAHNQTTAIELLVGRGEWIDSLRCDDFT